MPNESGRNEEREIPIVNARQCGINEHKFVVVENVGWSTLSRREKCGDALSRNEDGYAETGWPEALGLDILVSKSMPYAKKRPAIPKGVSDAVFKEYSHLCAICAEKDPQLHHLDENRENNDPLNLLPLCPNCHLTDQHNPTTKRPIALLSLFRRYKDPFILAPQFRPIFERMTFMYGDWSSCNEDVLAPKVTDLVNFISELEMGKYYADQIHSLLFNMPVPGIINLSSADSLERYQQMQREEFLAYLGKLKEATTKAESHIVEILRFQNWPAPQKAT